MRKVVTIPYWVGVFPQQPTSLEYILVVTDDGRRIPAGFLAIMVSGQDTPPLIIRATSPAEAARDYLAERPGLAERVQVVARIGNQPDVPLSISRSPYATSWLDELTAIAGWGLIVLGVLAAAVLWGRLF